MNERLVQNPDNLDPQEQSSKIFTRQISRRGLFGLTAAVIVARVVDGLPIKISEVESVEAEKPFNGVMFMDYAFVQNATKIRWRAYNRTDGSGVSVLGQWGRTFSNKPINGETFELKGGDCVIDCPSFYTATRVLRPQFIDSLMNIRIGRSIQEPEGGDFLASPLRIKSVDSRKKRIVLKSSVHPTGYEQSVVLRLGKSIYGEGKKGLVLLTFPLAGFSSFGEIDKTPPVFVAFSKPVIGRATLEFTGYSDGAVVKRYYNGEDTGEQYVVKNSRIRINQSGLYDPQ